MEAYDAAHAQIVQRAGAAIDGLLFHVARTTRNGFQVIEVWESEHNFARYNDELVGPVMAEIFPGQAPPSGPQYEEFEIRGLVIPRGDISSEAA